MNTRPILFSAPMVRALLAGTKTQTRRVVRAFKHADADGVHDCVKDEDGLPSRLDLALANWDRCPHGVPGDRLWVRETWAPADWMATGGYADPPQTVAYRADQTARVFRWEEPHTAVAANTYGWNWGSAGWKWKPSIFMPRWASRLTLEVTDVRVVRLREISQNDAVAEGAARLMSSGSPFPESAPKWSMEYPHPVAVDPVNGHKHCLGSPQMAFANKWNAINGKREGCSWDDNPWVWAISFKRAAP